MLLGNGVRVTVDVAGSKHRGERIIDGLQTALRRQLMREVAVLLGIGRHSLFFARRLHDLPFFIDKKIEQLVLDDGMADGTAEGVRPDDVRIARDAVGQRVQRRIAAEVVHRSVVFIGARLLRQVEGAARAEAKLRIHGVLLNGQLLHCVHRQVVRAPR